MKCNVCGEMILPGDEWPDGEGSVCVVKPGRAGVVQVGEGALFQFGLARLSYCTWTWWPTAATHKAPAIGREGKGGTRSIVTALYHGQR